MTPSYTDQETGVTTQYFIAEKEPVTWTTWIGDRKIVMRDGKILSDEIFPAGEAKPTSLDNSYKDKV
jgi:hypothetical protein